MAQAALRKPISDAPVTDPMDLRRHPRTQMYLLGRYMLPDRMEYPCQTRNVSAGGVALYAPVQGCEGDRIVLYLDQIGRLEGRVARAFPSGFAIEFLIPALKRDKLSDQIAWLSGSSALGLSEARRRGDAMETASLRLVTGEAFQTEIIDISLSGISLRFATKLPLGARLLVGKTAGRVMRNFEGGVAIEFLGPVQASGPGGAIEF